MINRKHPVGLLLVLICLSCSAQKKISRNDLLADFVNDPVFDLAHLGVSVYDPQQGKYLYDYQGTKFFVPASNVKIATCYAAMKYLKHILPGIQYYENDTAVYLIPTGDPTLLHRDFPNQPVIRFLQQQRKKLYITGLVFRDSTLGSGWSWDDYNEEYMTERSALPVYGNTIRWVQEKIQSRDTGPEQSVSVYSDPEVNWKLRFDNDTTRKQFHVQRERMANIFHVTQGTEPHAEQSVPFAVNGLQSALELLADTIGREIGYSDHFQAFEPLPQQVWSQPVDSVLRPMMYRSDNFFAEQLLLMVSAGNLGVMNDARIIDTLLHADFHDLPQQPVWVDGCGMSRYNLFSPHIFISILDRMRKEFGMERVKSIFPTGDSGTLKGYYRQGGNYIYAKTGSMSGVLALSGFLYAQNGRLLEFSILVNNYTGSSVAMRRRIEKFIHAVRQQRF